MKYHMGPHWIILISFSIAARGIGLLKISLFDEYALPDRGIDGFLLNYQAKSC